MEVTVTEQDEDILAKGKEGAYKAFMETYVPRAKVIDYGAQEMCLIVSETDIFLPRVMEWLHQYSPAIVSLTVAEMVVNQAIAPLRITRGEIFQIAERAVTDLLTVKDKHTFKVGFNVAVFVRGEHMSIAPEIKRVAESLGADTEIYRHALE